jgi:hypothetical protein
MLGYELIKLLDKATEDQTEPEYFVLLQGSFEALNNPHITLDIIAGWFRMQLLRLSGHIPNLYTQADGTTLEATQRYRFDTATMSFERDPEGMITAAHIKFLRLAANNHTPLAIASVQGAATIASECLPLIRRFGELQGQY